MIVRDFQSVIGDEARKQIRAREGRLPDELVACVGGGSNAIGLFYPFLGDAGRGDGRRRGGRRRASTTGRHAASITGGTVGVLHGKKTYVLQDELGQIRAGALDLGRPRLPGRRPGARLSARQRPRARTSRSPTPRRSQALQLLTATEGIIPALETAHAIAYAIAARADAARATRSSSSTCPGAATRTWTRVASYLGVTL